MVIEYTTLAMCRNDLPKIIFYVDGQSIVRKFTMTNCVLVPCPILTGRIMLLSETKESSRNPNRGVVIDLSKYESFIIFHAFKNMMSAKFLVLMRIICKLILAIRGVATNASTCRLLL